VVPRAVLGSQILQAIAKCWKESRLYEKMLPGFRIILEDSNVTKTKFAGFLQLISENVMGKLYK